MLRNIRDFFLNIYLFSSIGSSGFALRCHRKCNRIPSSAGSFVALHGGEKTSKFSTSPISNWLTFHLRFLLYLFIDFRVDGGAHEASPTLARAHVAVESRNSSEIEILFSSFSFKKTHNRMVALSRGILSPARWLFERTNRTQINPQEMKKKYINFFSFRLLFNAIADLRQTDREKVFCWNVIKFNGRLSPSDWIKRRDFKQQHLQSIRRPTRFTCAKREPNRGQRF